MRRSLPVTILPLSAVAAMLVVAAACGPDTVEREVPAPPAAEEREHTIELGPEEQERLDAEQVRIREVPIPLDAPLEQAIEADDRNAFVQSAEQALSRAEQELQRVQHRADDMTEVQDVQNRIAATRAQIQQVPPGEDWQDAARDIESEVNRIQQDLESIAT